MDKRVQRKKAEAGAGVDLSKPKTLKKPVRSAGMEANRRNATKDSEDFLSGVVSFRLEQAQLGDLMKEANTMGMSAGQLARSFVMQRLNQSTSQHFSQSQHDELRSLVREATVEYLQSILPKSRE